MEGIADFSAERWGVDRAQRYLAALDDAFVGLLDRPDRGRRLDDLYPPWLFRRAGRHMIVYRVDADEVYVARVLHDRIEPKRHLP